MVNLGLGTPLLQPEEEPKDVSSSVGMGTEMSAIQPPLVEPIAKTKQEPVGKTPTELSPEQEPNTSVTPKNNLFSDSKKPETKQNQSSLTKKPLTPKTSAETSSSIIKSLLGNDIKTTGLTAAFGLLKLLPLPERTLTLAVLHKALPNSLTLNDYSKAIFTKNDVENIVNAVRKNPSAKSAEGNVWGNMGLSKNDAKNMSFSIGGFSYNVLTTDKSGRPTKIEFKDSYDFENNQRRKRIEEFKQQEEDIGFFRAFLKNLKNSFNETPDNKQLYSGSNVKTTNSKEFFSRVFGETLFNNADTAPQFNTVINIEYNRDGTIKNHYF